MIWIVHVSPTCNSYNILIRAQCIRDCHTYRPTYFDEPAQLTQLILNMDKMSLEDQQGIDDTGGYASGDILASDSEGDETGSLDAAAVKKSLLRADQVLELVKQSRKRVLPPSSDESEPDDGEMLLPPTASSSKLTRKNCGSKSNSQPKQLLSPPSKTPTAMCTVTGMSCSSHKTPLRKDTETAAALASKSSSSTPRNSRKAVDKTPKGRKSGHDSGTLPETPCDMLNGSPEETRNIMATLKEISNTLSQVVTRMDRQESRMQCMEKKINERGTPSSSSSSA